LPSPESEAVKSLPICHTGARLAERGPTAKLKTKVLGGGYGRAMFGGLVEWWEATPTTELVWIAVGLIAQLMFSMRFIVQWVATERARASIVPEMFWYFSFAGGLLLLSYAIYRLDPVFILGQATGLVIYTRNIYFIWLGKRVPGTSKLT
jgi:lipid-A-disaccharide synthase-like uncharacterized protein